MRRWRGLFNVLLVLFLVIPVARPAGGAAAELPGGPITVYVLPIRWDVMPTLLNLVERGIEEANKAQADILIIDLHADGGRVDVTEEILKLIEGFRPDDKEAITVTFVNDKAISVGALIAMGTQQVFMAPGARIGDVAPDKMSPGGVSVEQWSGTMEEKVAAHVRALARRYAEKNGHNVEVVEAMINRDHEDLEIAGEMICPRGQLLQLTARDAERQMGEPPVTMFSEGTKDSIEGVLAAMGVYDAMEGRRQDLEHSGLRPAVVVRVEPTEFELAGFWFATISPILMIVGIVGLFIEFKTPGFGVPGAVGIGAFALFFLGGYMADLTGKEWMIGCFLLFLVGIGLVVLEFYVFPGTVALGAMGGIAVLTALLFAQMDLSSSKWRMPTMPDISQSFLNLFIALVGAGVVLWLLAKILPRSSVYSRFAMVSASGVESTVALVAEQETQLGQVGVVQAPLQPGGKAMFGDELRDVISQGDPIDAGQRVRIIDHSGHAAVVEPDVGD